jgi:hypothetical protein
VLLVGHTCVDVVAPKGQAESSPSQTLTLAIRLQRSALRLFFVSFELDCFFLKARVLPGIKTRESFVIDSVSPGLTQPNTAGGLE